MLEFERLADKVINHYGYGSRVNRLVNDAYFHEPIHGSILFSVMPKQKPTRTI